MWVAGAAQRCTEALIMASSSYSEGGQPRKQQSVLEVAVLSCDGRQCRCTSTDELHKVASMDPSGSSSQSAYHFCSNQEMLFRIIRTLLKVKWEAQVLTKAATPAILAACSKVHLSLQFGILLNSHLPPAEPAFTGPAPKALHQESHVLPSHCTARPDGISQLTEKREACWLLRVHPDLALTGALPCFGQASAWTS